MHMGHGFEFVYVRIHVCGLSNNSCLHLSTQKLPLKHCAVVEQLTHGCSAIHTHWIADSTLCSKEQESHIFKALMKPWKLSVSFS